MGSGADVAGTAIDSGTDPPGLGGLGLLRRNRAFRTLWSARVISYAGDSLSLVALMLHVAESTGQAFAIALLLLVGDFAPALLGPLTGALSDRFDLRRVMIGAELVQGGVLLLIAVLLPPLPVLLALVAVRAIAGQVFQPASRAAVPALVRDRDLESANAGIGFGTNGGEAIGPLLAAALFPLVGVRGVLLVDAVSFLLSAVLLSSLPGLPAAPADGAARGSLLRDARAGLGYLWSTPIVRTILLGFCAVVAFNGVDDVALVLLATDTFRAGNSAVGLLLGAVGIGLFAGYLLLARYGVRAHMAGLLIAGFAVSSVGNLLTGLAWAVGAALLLQAVRGLGIAAMDVATNTLLQRAVPERMLGRVFGNLYGAVGVAAALSYLGGALLLDATSAPTTLLVAGAGGTLATIVTAWALHRSWHRAAGSAQPDQRT
ncbi:MFS transporter [Plantactinospora soyae]|uniref:MFS family permease n=1 Tax=Plantactinospora soyae TaxID=1544732 RepID=A0A927M4T6_9ACTN|nr:MFS transporter [Plantactinospora soyae]MBE1484480.1 MFS family permease [Plantactinospora soyae]